MSSPGEAGSARLSLPAADDTSRRSLVLKFVGLTLALTWLVILGWEKGLREPFYHWVERNYPPDKQWAIEQRTEHFLISTSVDFIVITLLLRLVSHQQRSLRSREALYRALFEHANDGIGVVAATDYRFVDVNSRLGAILGYPSKDLVGKDLRELVADTGEETTGSRFIELFAQYPSGECETLMRTSGGRLLPASVSYGTLTYGEENLIILIVRDLSERKQAEEDLKKLSSAIEQTADTVCITDTRGVIEYVNPAFEKLTGYTREEAIGKTFSLLKSGKHPDRLYQSLWKTILSGNIFRAVLINRKKNGETYYEEKTLSPLKDSNGNMTHFVSTGKDITERKRAEEALYESEARYRLLFESNPLPMWVFDRSTLRFLAVNESAVRHYGYSREEFLAMTINDIRPVEDIPILTEYLKRSTPELDFAGTFRHCKKDGTLITVEITAHKLTFAGRDAECVLPLDVTERKRLESEKEEMQRQLFQSSKLASIGELSAGVAHEIGNPVNSVINFAQLLKDDNVAQTDMHRQMINGIIEDGGRIAKIVRDLLAFARRDSQDLTRVNIADVVNTSVSLFGRQLNTDGISVEVELEHDLPPVIASGSLLRQVIVNMITNALHALRDKGSDGKEFRIKARRIEKNGDGFVAMRFFDNGIGIRREIRDKIFDPFFTTRRDCGGTGLGLSLTFGIIRSYGGTITVDSEEGHYTEFVVELPAATTVDSPNSDLFLAG